MYTSFAKVEQEAMALSAGDRARLADKLWDSLADHPLRNMQMTPELERLLDEGLENLDQAKTTDELRRRA
jgi:putative addiction module component (TIGR02574 family)